VLLRLLRQRFGDAVDVQVEQRIATASLEQVEAWTGRVLSAATLAEVLTKWSTRIIGRLSVRMRMASHG